MNEKPYAATSYRMRNEQAWMVVEHPGGRVVVLGLRETEAAILAELLNVALLAAPIVRYDRGKPAVRASRTRNSARRNSDVDKPLS